MNGYDADMAHPSLSRMLREDRFPAIASKRLYERKLEALQRRMLVIQQGIFHARRRAIIAIEGFDAAGKGGAIRRLTEGVDPRGVKVVPIGPPTEDEQGRHWLYRFWRELPLPGDITVFDRTWYGRVLVERVDGLTHKRDWKRAYREINEFERMLVEDGIDLVKIFLASATRSSSAGSRSGSAIPTSSGSWRTRTSGRASAGTTTSRRSTTRSPGPTRRGLAGTSSRASGSGTRGWRCSAS